MPPQKMHPPRTCRYPLQLAVGDIEGIQRAVLDSVGCGIQLADVAGHTNTQHQQALRGESKEAAAVVCCTRELVCHHALGPCVGLHANSGKKVQRRSSTVQFRLL